MKLCELTLNCKSGKEFEKRVLKFLQDLGFVGKIVGYDDCGVDIIVTIKVGNVEKTYNIQCKYYNTTIGKQPVHEVFSGNNYYNNNGIPVVITNNKMTMKALEFAKKQGVEIICEYDWIDVEKAENSNDITQKLGLLGVIIGKIIENSTYIVNAIKNISKSKEETKEENAEREFTNKVARKQWESEEKLREKQSNQHITEFIGKKMDYG